jgi:glycosyltransferase involved in cell wall biosynthesis
MKLAFVTTLKPQNNDTFYGAETSLKFLIQSIRQEHINIDISLIIREPFLSSSKLKKEEKTAISNFLKIYPENIIYTWVPYVSFPIEKINFKGFIRYILTYFLLIYKKYGSKKINLNSFDHIHINNTHLFLFHKLLNKKTNYSQHIRDYIWHPYLYKSNAKFFIPIDKKTQSQLNYKYYAISHIITNTYIPNFIFNNIYKKKFSQYKYIFCIVGQIAKIKGVEYVIDEFIEFNNKDSCLIIVGGVTDLDYYNDILFKTINISNIILTGNLSNVSEIYNIAHYNIRGDEHFCIGRTTIESVMHGLINIIPCKVNESPDFENDNISKKIEKYSIYYTARSKNALKDVLLSCITNPLPEKNDIIMYNPIESKINFINIVNEYNYE